MRKLLLGLACMTVLAAPATAADVENLAKTILDAGSILKKAEASCGPSARLSKRNALDLTYARAAVEQSVPISQFQTLYQTSEAEAISASAGSGFCADTKKTKPALMTQIKKAAKALVAAKGLR